MIKTLLIERKLVNPMVLKYNTTCFKKRRQQKPAIDPKEDEVNKTPTSVCLPNLAAVSLT